MNTAFFIKRPVFTLVCCLLLVIVGVLSFTRLTMREYPPINLPIISITTTYSGASAALIEHEVTTSLENRLSGIAGVERMKSSSQQGKSSIQLHFETNTNMQEAMDEVRTHLASARNDLPDNASDPVIRRIAAGSEAAIYLSLTDKNKDALALTTYYEQYLKTTFENLPGVGQVSRFGGAEYQVQVWLDSAKMAARGITANDVQQALKERAHSMPGGEISSLKRNYSINIKTQISSVKAIGDITLTTPQHTITHLRDIASIKTGAPADNSLFRVDGVPALGLGIVPQSTANPVEVANATKAAIKRLQMTLPAGMKLNIIYNNAAFIEQSISDVYYTLFITICLVMMVVLVFLGNWRSALIPIITIPICLLAVFWPLKMMGYSINTMTMLALVLAIGLIVDDAIVMLENIYRHVQDGMPLMAAAFKGSREIGFAIVAMTLTLAAVYAPLAFSDGLSGQLLREFGFTLAAAVIISGFLALTLSPMMCAYLLSAEEAKTRYHQFIETTLATLTQRYKKLLTLVLKKRFYVLIFLFALMGGGYFVAKQLPMMLVPTEDQSLVMGIFSTPVSSSFDYTQSFVEQIEAINRSIPEARTSFLSVGWGGPGSAFAFITLKPWEQRSRSQSDIKNDLQKQYNELIGINAFAAEPNLLRRGNGEHHNLTMVLLSALPNEKLQGISQEFTQALKAYPGVTEMSENEVASSDQYSIAIKYQVAADRQVPVSRITNTIAVLLGKQHVIDLQDGSLSFPVILGLPPSARDKIDVLQKQYIRNNAGQLISLGELLNVKEVAQPMLYTHYNRLNASYLSANLVPGYRLQDVVLAVSQLAKEKLPDNVQLQFTGAARDTMNAKHSNLLIFLMALLFIYLALSAQFESFIDPFIILLSVPLSIVGGLVALKLSGGSLNLYSSIGMVTLIGLITKHGILITEFANRSMLLGKDKTQAVIEAATMRLRPILMTTAAMVLGALPLAFATGAGANSRHQIGWVIVGGIAIGTVFALFIVPIAYTFRPWRVKEENALVPAVPPELALHVKHSEK